MADLPTNYLDDILAQSMNGKRKFRITRPDGTFEEVIIEDISEYLQTGSTFGAGDINRTNQAVNEKFDSGDVVDPMLTTELGFAADAYQTKLQFDEQNKNINALAPVNNLTSSSTTAPLSANQGRVLNASINGMIKFGTFTGTPTSSGNLPTDKKATNITILSAWISSGCNGVALPYRRSNDSVWCFHVSDPDTTLPPITSSVTIKYAYIEKTS